MLTTGSRQLVEQCLCLFEVLGVETLSEPIVDGCEQVAAEPGELATARNSQSLAPCSTAMLSALR